MTVRDRLLGLDDRADWDAVLAGLPHGYWHTWRANAAVFAGMASPAYLFVHEDLDTGGIAACAFAERDWDDSRDVFTPVGFTGFVGVGDCPRARAQWLRLAIERRYVCGYFALHPVASRKEFHAGLVETNQLYVLDLTCGFESVVERSSRSVRRSLAIWQKEKNAFTVARDEICDFINMNYDAFMESVGASHRTRLPPATLRAMLQDDAILMAGVRDSDGICAAHTFALSGLGAESHLNVSIRDGRKYTTALLLWGIQQLTQRHVAWLNMGGGVRVGDNVARAKEKYAPETKPLLAAREIYDQIRYERLRKKFCNGSSATSGYFPEYRLGN